MPGEFKDNAYKPIIAWDFDCTITDSNIFPAIGNPRRYIKEVMNLLYDVGVVNIIWTCRDKSASEDDIQPMVDWLNDNGIRFNAINHCIQYAPFRYEARKIYAHMYVDDKAYGWLDRDGIILDVMYNFLDNIVGVDIYTIDRIIRRIQDGVEVSDDIRQKVKDYVLRWRM